MPRNPELTGITIDAALLPEQEDYVQYAQTAISVVNACQNYGFAIVRNALPPEVFEAVNDESQRVFDRMYVSGQVRHFNSKEAAGVVKTLERATIFSDKTQEIMGAIAVRLAEAAHGVARMETPDAVVNTMFVTKYEPKGKVAKHRDPTTGVWCDLSLEGRALMGFWDGWRKIGDVILNPNDMVVTPALTPGSNRRHLVKHDVINITRAHTGGSGHRADRLSRYSLIFGYGRTRGHAVANKA